MASFIQLMRNKINDIIYPQTLVKAVYDDDGNRLDNLILTKNNKIPYTPTEEYNPSTKGYVDANSISPLDSIILDGGSASTEISE